MFLHRFHTFILLISFSSIFAQQKTNEGSEGLGKSSNILRSNISDTAFLKLEMRNVSYDFSRNKLPYLLISKTTAYNESASAQLVIKKTKAVPEPHASVIRTNFKEYLRKNYSAEAVPSYCKNENLNQHILIPFTINEAGKIEELIDFDVIWSVKKNEEQANLRKVSTFKDNSILSSGKWYKIAVTQNGIHVINKAFLNNIGINTANLDPGKIRIYGNGGKMLPERNKDFRYDDLEENAIQVILSNGNFDHLLFYATGANNWVQTKSQTGLKYRAVKNLYSDTSFYFINVDAGPGKRITMQPSLQQSANVSTSTYDYYNFHEEDIVNFGTSGRHWYGEYFDIITSYKFDWNDGDFVENDSIISQVSIAAAHKETSDFLIQGNGINFICTTPLLIPGQYADYATQSVKTGYALNNSSNNIGISISKLTPRSRGWLDKLTINARRRLVLRNKQFLFRDSRISAPGKICNFTISNPTNAIFNLWNVSDPLNPYIQAFNNNGQIGSFTAYADSLNEYCIAPVSDYITPVFVGKIINQNLHNIRQADYVIVTHPLFIKEAERIAIFHQQKEGLTYAIATTDQIYNEFSSGRPDISAIRDFIRMIYSRNINNGTQVKYALLIGDGSYNNKSRNPLKNSNLIPTYQSHVSLSRTSSIATDDFYGLMDPDEGYYAEDIGNIDIGIGRFTCRTNQEVKAVIDKIENYYKKDAAFEVKMSEPENCNFLSESTMGDWRNWLLFLGDDEDRALHMEQSDSLANFVSSINKNYNIDKILLDAYQRFSTPGGFRYPDAAEEFLKRIRKGSLIFNYTGHGGEVGLTAERMIDNDIINNLDNFNKLPLFITATCEFSRYDDPARTSAGELCLLNSKGGAIALMTTCRLAFSNTNYTLNLVLLRKLFSRLSNGNYPTLGDAIQLTKSELRQSFVYANFHLLGDPAMPLAYPEHKVVTSGINNNQVSISSSDTLSALSKITVTGFVSDNQGNKLKNFKGIVYPTVFDKEQTVTCLINSEDSRWSGDADGGAFKFKLQKNILYRGKSEVKNGDFSFTFIVPKDISFSYGPGKISYYATNGLQDATGSYTQVSVGGISTNGTVDNEGPKVELYLNDKNYINGGLTNEKPVLYADLIDSSGINTIGTGIGHDISVILDQNTSKPVILNDFYEANLNSYQSGRVRYPFNELSEGNHRLSFKVWDIQNNSSTVYADFVVAKSAELAIEHVLNYPNPFTTHTKFMFQQNQPCTPLNVSIQIYTISGKNVKTIQKMVTCEGFVSQGVDWDGKDEFGDKLGRGVYIYKLAIINSENKKAEKIEKLVILN